MCTAELPHPLTSGLRTKEQEQQLLHSGLYEQALGGVVPKQQLQTVLGQEQGTCTVLTSDTNKF